MISPFLDAFPRLSHVVRSRLMTPSSFGPGPVPPWCWPLVRSTLGGCSWWNGCHWVILFRRRKLPCLDLILFCKSFKIKIIPGIFLTLFCTCFFFGGVCHQKLTDLRNMTCFFGGWRQDLDGLDLIFQGERKSLRYIGWGCQHLVSWHSWHSYR